MGGRKDGQPRTHLTPLQKLRYGDPNEPDSIPGEFYRKEKPDHSFGQYGEDSHQPPKKYEGGEEVDYIMAKSVIYPRSWDDSKSQKNPQTTLYIGEKALEYLMSKERGQKSRWKNLRRKWIKKEKSQKKGFDHGIWEYRMRTPKNMKTGIPFDSSKFVPKRVVDKAFEDMKKSELQVECKNRELSTTGNKFELITRLNAHDKGRIRRKQGKKPHGRAKAVRREAWLILANPRHVWKLINTSSLIDFDVGKKGKGVSLNIPNLEQEIAELIIDEMVCSKRGFQDIPETRQILFDWLTKYKVDVEISAVEGALEYDSDELKPVILALVKKHWKKLLSRWIELNAIFVQHHKSEELDTIPLNNPKIPEKEVQMTKEEELDQLYKDLPFDEHLENRTFYFIEPDEEE